jgi:hypothetical protein
MTDKRGRGVAREYYGCYHDRHVACVNKLMKEEWARKAKNDAVHPGIFLKRLKSIRKFFGI